MGAFDLMGTYSDEASNRSKFIIDLFEDFGNDVGLGDIALVGLDVSFMNVMRHQSRGRGRPWSSLRIPSRSSQRLGLRP